MTITQTPVVARRKVMSLRSVWLPGFFLVLGFLFVAANGAHAETRTLKIHFVHTGEKAEIAFKRDGRYLPDGLQKINRILRDWRRNEPTRMDPRLLDLVWAVYQKAGTSNYINVISAYRAPATNSMLRGRSRSSGVAKNSQHTLGKAMDFFIPGVSLKKLREIGLKMQVGGVGYYPTSGSPFVHMDVGNVRHWPRMNRRELLALFPNGRTLHVPSDGKPLPGFEQALADYRSRKGAAPEVLMASTSSSKGKGFLASLFGGGADEAEDNSDSVAVASVAPQPSRKEAIRPTPSQALPGVGIGEASEQPAARQAETRETLVVALPPRLAPLPIAAPRPDLGVGAAAPQTEVALNIPLPTRRPNYVPTIDTVAGRNVVVAQASAAYGSSGDAIAAVLARESQRLKQESEAKVPGDGALQAFTGPLPSARPDYVDRPMTVAALPAARPQLLPERGGALRAVPAVLTTGKTSGKEARVVRTSTSASQRLALLSRQTGTDPAAALASGVRTTAKDDRPVAGEARPAPKSVAVPVQQEIARWALKTGAVTQPVAKSEAARLAYNVVSTAPRAVYTTGFQHGDLGKEAQRFTGKAVTFLSVAKFGTE